jgi:tetratricopeptide (TPR) repeat protein
MTRRAFLLAALILIAPAAAAEAAERADTADKLFYLGNAHYEKGEYAKAIENYAKIVDDGIESGRLYYNMGNAFFKLGKLGHAILAYEKARRLIPGDSDLKSNLEYARSLVEGGTYYEPHGNFALKLAARPFKGLSLGAVAATGAFLYIAVVVMALANTYYPAFARKTRLVFILLVAALSWNIAIFAIRYYHEEVLKPGIVVQKTAECKYEPIDKSATYYKLGEGDKVFILKERNGWLRIRKVDGKSSWVRKGTVEEI